MHKYIYYFKNKLEECDNNLLKLLDIPKRIKYNFYINIDYNYENNSKIGFTIKYNHIIDKRLINIGNLPEELVHRIYKECQFVVVFNFEIYLVEGFPLTPPVFYLKNHNTNRVEIIEYILNKISDYNTINNLNWNPAMSKIEKELLSFISFIDIYKLVNKFIININNG